MRPSTAIPGWHDARYDGIGGREVLYLKTADGHVNFERSQFVPAQKYCMQVQADETLTLSGKSVKAPPSRPFYFYGPLRAPKVVSVKWDGPNLMVNWETVAGAIEYELTLCTGDKERVIRVTGISWTVCFSDYSFSSNTRVTMPNRLELRSVGGTELECYSERSSKASIPKRLLPPISISLVWKTPKRLALRWEEVQGSERYKIRFYNDSKSDGKCVSSRTAQVSKWEGDCKVALPFKVTISSIAGDGFESDESEEVDAPSHSESESKKGSRTASAKEVPGKITDDQSEIDVSSSDEDAGGGSHEHSDSGLISGESESEAEPESESDLDYDDEDDSDFESSLPFKGPRKDKEVSPHTATTLTQPLTFGLET